MANEVFGRHCRPNPDIAGLGVVISIVSAGFATVILSAVCGILKLSMLYLENAETNVSLQRPSHFLHKALGPLLDQREVFWRVNDRRKKLGLWHRVLDKALLGLGLNQLVAGYALMVSNLWTYRSLSNDPHALLAMWLSGSSMIGQAMIPFVLQRPNKSHAYFSLWASNIYMLGLSIMGTVQAPMTLLWGSTAVLASTVIFAATKSIRDLLLDPAQVQSITEDRDSKPDISEIPLLQVVSFVIFGSAVIGGLIRALQLKFGRSKLGCDLNAAEENAWTLGQVLAVIMLLALVLPTLSAYWEEIEELQEETATTADELETTDPASHNSTGSASEDEFPSEEDNESPTSPSIDLVAENLEHVMDGAIAEAPAVQSSTSELDEVQGGIADGPEGDLSLASPAHTSTYGSDPEN